MTTPSYTVWLEDEHSTLEFGKKIAALSAAIHTIYLEGPLGVGKTTLTRAILQALGHQGAVKSPTYTLVETYTLHHRTIHHFDLYRIAGDADLEEMGFRDYFSEDTLCLVEWPSKAKQLPKADLKCELALTERGRIITVSADTDTGLKVLLQLGNPT